MLQMLKVTRRNRGWDNSRALGTLFPTVYGWKQELCQSQAVSRADDQEPGGQHEGTYPKVNSGSLLNALSKRESVHLGSLLSKCFPIFLKMTYLIFCGGILFTNFADWKQSREIRHATWGAHAWGALIPSHSWLWNVALAVYSRKWHYNKIFAKRNS